MYKRTRFLLMVPDYNVFPETQVTEKEKEGWTVLLTDTDILYADLEDIRKDDERGRR